MFLRLSDSIRHICRLVAALIAAAVIGGASLNGGSGTILGAILGMALLSVVTSSLVLLNVSVYWQDMIKGCILLAAVSVDHFLNKRKPS